VTYLEWVGIVIPVVRCVLQAEGDRHVEAYVCRRCGGRNVVQLCRVHGLVSVRQRAAGHRRADQTIVIDFTNKIIETPLVLKRDPKIERRPRPTVPTAGGLTRIPPTRPGRLSSCGRTSAGLLRSWRRRRPRPRRERHRGRPRCAAARAPWSRSTRRMPQGHGVEGWVQIQFAVTAAGTVRDPFVVAAEPQGEFRGRGAPKSHRSLALHPAHRRRRSGRARGVQTVIRSSSRSSGINGFRGTGPARQTSAYRSRMLRRILLS